MTAQFNDVLQLTVSNDVTSLK